MILFWCLMAKGEKLRLKQMDQLPLENFENSRVRTFVLSKYSKCLFLSKVGLLWGDCLIMGKRGSF
jgi:aminopeptidase C